MDGSTSRASSDRASLWRVSAQVVSGAVDPGDYVCADCGYGVSVSRSLPACPMCRGHGWRQARRKHVRRASLT